MEKEANLKKIFYIFLIVHLLLWSGIALLRVILPIDAAECVYWGSLMDLGTNKHPPLAGWISYFIFRLFGSHEFPIYVLGQVFIVTGFYYIYKIGKLFLDETKAILSVMILETCYVYSYCTIYDGFNPNFILFCLLPAIVYYFYQALNSNKLINWIILGVLSGLALLAKYQAVMVLFSMLLYLIFTKDGRSQFKKIGLYLSLVIAFVMFLPHLIWLFKTEFFPMQYFLLSEEKYSTFIQGPLRFIFAPALFLFRQLVTILGIIFVYFSAKFIFKSPIKFNKNLNKDAVFLIYAGILPMILQTLPGFINGIYMIPVWGFTLLFLTGVLIFYFFPMEISDKIIKYIFAWIIVGMVAISTVLCIVFTTFKDFSCLFPTRYVAENLREIYSSETGKPLKYIGGFIEFSIPISLREKDLTAVLDCWGHKQQWLDEEDILKNGMIIMDRNQKLIPITAKSLFPNNDNIKLSETKILKVKVTNKAGRSKVHNLYYAIISPVN